MGQQRYTDEFRREAVRQVIEKGHAVKDVAERLGVSTHSLYEWLRKARAVSGPGESAGAQGRRDSPAAS